MKTRRVREGLRCGVAVLGMMGVAGCAGGGGVEQGRGVADVQAPGVAAVAGGALALRSELPAWQEDCLAAQREDFDCRDDDGDGLSDAWEDLVSERLRPMVELDEGEDLVEDGDRLAVVTRVAPLPEGDVLAIFALLYTRDYGKLGFTEHAGDSERVALRLAFDGGPGDVVVSEAYTAAHEGESADASARHDGRELVLRELDGQPRWVVFSSENKHASYVSRSACEAHWLEDCGAEGRERDGRYHVLAPWANAGELAAPFFRELDFLGFPGEDAWAMGAGAQFCGGLGGDGCASPVGQKLEESPF